MLLVLLLLLLMLLFCAGASFVGVGSIAASVGAFVANAHVSAYLLLLMGCC